MNNIKKKRLFDEAIAERTKAKEDLQSIQTLFLTLTVKRSAIRLFSDGNVFVRLHSDYTIPSANAIAAGFD